MGSKTRAQYGLGSRTLKYNFRIRFFFGYF